MLVLLIALCGLLDAPVIANSGGTLVVATAIIAEVRANTRLKWLALARRADARLEDATKVAPVDVAA